MKTIEPDNAKTLFHVVYLAERNGIYRPHAFSSKDLEHYGGEVGLEVMLATEYDWFERLGIVTASVGKYAGDKPAFSVSDLEQLIAQASRKMILIDDNEFEYVAADGPVRKANP